MATPGAPTVYHPTNGTLLVPRPTDALLICEVCQEPTFHVFERNQKVGEYGAYAQIFRCVCCKSERRYGLYV